MFEKQEMCGQSLSANQVCSTANPSQPEISRELDRLSSSIDRLRNKLEMTYKKLNPIIENIPVCSGSDKCADVSVNTQIGKSIREKSIEIETITNAVEEMYSRIAV